MKEFTVNLILSLSFIGCMQILQRKFKINLHSVRLIRFGNTSWNTRLSMISLGSIVLVTNKLPDIWASIKPVFKKLYCCCCHCNDIDMSEGKWMLIFTMLVFLFLLGSTVWKTQNLNLLLPSFRSILKKCTETDAGGGGAFLNNNSGPM